MESSTSKVTEQDSSMASQGIDYDQLSNFLDSKLDAKLDSLKREISEESTLNLNSAVKRAKYSTRDFKREGCKKQHRHNEEVKDKLEEAISSIDSGKIDKAKQLLEEGIQIIDKRQKVVKIADNYGWDTVQAYVSDDLASGSEDDKRLSKAIRQAQFNRRERDRKRRKQDSRARQNFRPSSSFTYTSNKPQSAAISNTTGSTNRSYQTCWACGQIGHMQYQCPQRPNGSWQAGKKVV